MSTKFNLGDLTDQQFKDNRQAAYRMYWTGFQPTFSTGICDSITAGFGRLDEFGYWEYPLMVDQDSWKIVEEIQNGC